jgi:hypothetical protein
MTQVWDNKASLLYYACEPLLTHIHEILCNNNEAATEFVLKTLACIIQGVEKGHLHWIKSQVCMIFLSKPGSGKGNVVMLAARSRASILYNADSTPINRQSPVPPYTYSCLYRAVASIFSPSCNGCYAVPAAPL